MNFKAEQKLLNCAGNGRSAARTELPWHLLFEASLTQPNSANLLGKKSEQQRGTGPSYM